MLGRFKDYVAMPKFNMYQSLHTTVIGPQGKPVEMQIRTYAMHRRAEYGVASHWKYKENRRAGIDTDQLGDLEDMNWVRQLLDWQSDVEDPGEFLESLRFEINRAEVYVFTPRGDVIALPVGATPVDFAYAVHTEVGHHTIGARVNGRLVPLESTLDNSDVVEIFTSKAPTAGPVARLAAVRQVAARALARSSSGSPRSAARRPSSAARTRSPSSCARRGSRSSGCSSHESLTLAAMHFRLADVSALYAAVGENNLSAQAVVRRVIELHGGEDGAQEDLAEAVSITTPHGAVEGVVAGGVRGHRQGCTRRLGQARQAAVRRCRPTRSSASSPRAAASRCTARDCTNAAELERQPERLLDVEWAPTAHSTFLVNIQVEAIDRARLLSDITMVLSDAHVNILSATLSTTRDRVAKSRFTFEMAEAKHLDTVLRAVRSVPGVFDAYRVTQ